MKIKMIQVEEDTHKQIKLQATKAGASIKEYLQLLVEKDIKNDKNKTK